LENMLLFHFELSSYALIQVHLSEI
jgi:hypothetical protein